MPRKQQRRRPTKVPGIWRNEDGTFLVRITWNDPRTGIRKKREQTVDTMQEALAIRAEPRGEVKKPSRESLRDFVTRWANEHMKRLEPSTKERYVQAVARLSMELGDVYVDALTPSDVRQMLDRARDEFAPSTINGWLSVFRLALDLAIEEGTLVSNPARRTRALPTPRTTGKRAVSLGPDQFHRFLAATEALTNEGAISPDIGRMIVVLAWTGCRISEVRALKWTRVDSDEIHVVRSVWRRAEKGTKQNEPRTLPQVAPLQRAIEAQRQWLIDVEHPGLDSGLVFPASPRHAKAGASRRKAKTLSWYRSRSCLNKPLLMACERAEVPCLCPHALRRGFEKLLRRADVDGLVRRSLAGWASTDAQEIYTDVDAKDRADALGSVMKLVEAQAQNVRPSVTPSEQKPGTNIPPDA